MKTFLGFVLFPAWSAAAGLWSAFVLTKLWFWFVVPYFHVQPLTLALAYGLIVVVSFLTYHHDPVTASLDKRSLSERYTTGVVISALAPATSLLVGWIAHLFL